MPNANDRVCTCCKNKIKRTEKELQCSSCKFHVHTKCVNMSDSYLTVFKMKHVKFHCDGCLEIFENFDNALVNVDRHFVKSAVEIATIRESNKQLISEVNEMKQLLNNLGKDSMAVGTEFAKEMDIIKKELKVSFADVVKGEFKNEIKSVNTEVKNVSRKLDEESERKKRENNILVFGLKEQGTIIEEKNVVLKICKELSFDLIENTNDFKISRLGIKGESPRPMLVAVRNSNTKTAIMKNLFKIKSFDSDLNKIIIRHDLTPQQKFSLKKMIDKAKEKQANDHTGFLYRVRGELGEWRIVKFKKMELT
ncbi:hypothetical protein HELRODRAFT_158464 [Helobdella robusta]|uniref:Zinc finger PHD-type domain-containing protein n=1 Tax=Helobdella robusta TaxID=6412 RepID=T1EMT8_HELRO|nr:hypothetical protein HELRODRAFT_158464 [Helobdella robusta]ESO12055.1 hypothetical protein HELRODRAFT_158464 [Helobdella robusta]